jgi:CheY-like chemotaxis protein
MPKNKLVSRVLVVDDEHIIADTLALILKQSGFEAHAVYSGETAVEAALTLQPDVMISDVVMEGINGIEAAIRVSATLPHCRIILFSGNAVTAHLLDNAQAEGHSFETLLKPIHPQIILDRLSAYSCH